MIPGQVVYFVPCGSTTCACFTNVEWHTLRGIVLTHHDPNMMIKITYSRCDPEPEGSIGHWLSFHWKSALSSDWMKKVL